MGCSLKGSRLGPQNIVTKCNDALAPRCRLRVTPCHLPTGPMPTRGRRHTAPTFTPAPSHPRHLATAWAPMGKGMPHNHFTPGMVGRLGASSHQSHHCIFALASTLHLCTMPLIAVGHQPAWCISASTCPLHIRNRAPVVFQHGTMVGWLTMGWLMVTWGMVGWLIITQLIIMPHNHSISNNDET